MEEDALIHMPKGLEYMVKITTALHQRLAEFTKENSLPPELQGLTEELEVIRDLSRKLLADVDVVEYGAKRLRKGY
ncbi:hypothetical protein [Acidithiobacillus sulfurivorans]|uniref:Uncharacterized protein n=1 Tax=Acidithiobacillus sulfurivorans TaxID=1958756 RepID=A0ABS5ZYK7_9PROT|nr:hypothetical protein [Acidithiobacillus sulfurivorans]MBU2759525.1 hypothetical protein [Acidithiobacillus sulfurivorans]